MPPKVSISREYILSSLQIITDPRQSPHKRDFDYQCLPGKIYGNPSISDVIRLANGSDSWKDSGTKNRIVSATYLCQGYGSETISFEHFKKLNMKREIKMTKLFEA